MNVELAEKHFNFLLNYYMLEFYRKSDYDLYGIIKREYNENIKTFIKSLVGKKVIIIESLEVGYITRVNFRFGKFELRVQYSTTRINGSDYEYCYSEAIKFI